MFATSLVALSVAAVASAHAHGDHHAHKRADPWVTQCNHDWSLTYDDGPLPAHTNPISSALKDAGAKATFYMNGNNYRCIYDEDIVASVKQVHADGHQIAHHTWGHLDLNTLTNEQIDEQIQRLDEAFVKILGFKPRYLRPPFGSIDATRANYIATKHGKIVVTWDKDSGDSASPRPSAATLLNFYSSIVDAAGTSSPRPPQFTLHHDTLDITFQTYAESVSIIQNGGYNIVTTAECMDDASPYVQVGAPGVRDDTWTCTGTWVPTDPTPPTDPEPPTATCAWTYTALAGDNCATIGNDYGMTEAQVVAANPSWLTCSDIWAGTPICITTAKPACKSTYTAKAGDTCASIGTEFGISANAILTFNNYLNCADIWAGTPICVVSGNSVPPSSSTSTTVTTTSSSTGSTNPTPVCAVYYWSRPGEKTCSVIEDKLGMTAGSLQTANSFVNCADVWDWTALCIPANNSACSQTATASTATTCQQFGDLYGINQELVKYWNDFVNCNDIWAGTPLCVRH